MKVTVSFEVEHKNLEKLQKIVQYTHGFAHIPTGLDGVVKGAMSGDSPTVQNLPKDETPPVETAVAPPARPAVEKPVEANPDEVRAAMLAYSKAKSTEEAVAILKEYGKASKVKDVDASDYPALLEAFAL